MTTLEWQALLVLIEIKEPPRSHHKRLREFRKAVQRAYEQGLRQGAADARLIDSNRAESIKIITQLLQECV